jgi:hypothetical protein
VRLPSADDLFRPTDEESAGAHVRAVPTPRAAAQPAAEEEPAPTPRPSGRVRHDEKMTVYVTSEELLRIEHARLALRSQHGLAVDRGRLVREALALVLGDLEAHGDDCALVRRLSEG